MTIAVQWLIFGAACAGLFCWGLFAKNEQKDTSDAKEGHTARVKTTVNVPLEHHEDVHAAVGAGR